jgi:hypothetical protein
MQNELIRYPVQRYYLNVNPDIVTLRYESPFIIIGEILWENRRDEQIRRKKTNENILFYHNK